MKKLILEVLNEMNKDLIYDLIDVDLDGLKEALKEEGYTKHSSLSELQEGIQDLFDSVGCEEFQVYEIMD
jgi:hypothetical protein